MVNNASNADFAEIKRNAQAYSADYPMTRDWSNSDFGWLLRVPSATRGAVGRRMAADWISSLGFEVSRVSHDNQHYLDVGGHLIQVKLSTLWDNGEYRFQQIRDQDYDQVLCLGISPDDIHVWLIPKDVAIANLPGQHTGSGAHETSWLHTSPRGSFRWLDDYGNQLSDVARLLRGL